MIATSGQSKMKDAGTDRRKGHSEGIELIGLEDQ